MKTFKKILCIALSVLLCSSLIGCNFIDEMRLSQIYFNEKSNLVYDDKEYILLPYCEAFTPDFSKGKNLYITEKDVPVLLSETLGEYAELSSDKLYISTSDNYNTDEFYARSDVYEKIADRINKGNYFDGYLYGYSYFDVEANEFKYVKKFISSEMQVTMDTILSGEEITDIDIDLLYQFEVMSIYAGSKDFLFSQYAFTIYKTEKYIYLVNDNERVYIVPEDKVIPFEQLIKEYELVSQIDKTEDFIIN